MGWEPIKLTMTELSLPPYFAEWLIVGMLTLIMGVLLFILHASGTVKLLPFMNIWWLSLTLGGVWLILFSLRGWQWCQEIVEHLFHFKEAENSQQKWEIWASRQLTIPGSSVLLPHGVNADNILREYNTLPPQYTLSHRLNSDLSTEETLVKQCLAGIQNAVNMLPPDLQLNVTLLTDIPVQGKLKLAFMIAWKTIFPVRVIPDELSVADKLSVAWGASRLKESVLTVDLIMVLQLHDHDEYFDGLASLLLTSSAWLLMALTTDSVDRNDTTLLVMMTPEAEHFIGSLIPGNEYE